jgi:hypothetical protein
LGWAQTNTGLTLSVSRFSKKQADASTGRMQQVREAAAAKSIQSKWRQKCAWEDTILRMMDPEDPLGMSNLQQAALKQKQTLLARREQRRQQQEQTQEKLRADSVAAKAGQQWHPSSSCGATPCAVMPVCTHRRVHCI